MKMQLFKGVASLLLGSLLLSGCGKKVVETPVVIRPVMTIVAPEAGAVRQRTFSGTAAAAVETLLSFRVSGEIEALPVTKGSRVEAGDLIARLDAADYALQEKQSEAELANAHALLEQARGEYERSRKLYESDDTSKSALDSSRAAFKSAKASAESAAKGLELVRKQGGYCSLLAPEAGVIASVGVEIHETVAAGQTIAVLTSGDTLEINLGIPGALISQVEVGDPCRVRFDAVPGEDFEAIVKEVGIQTGASSTYPVSLALLQTDPRIRPGMVAEASLSFRGSTGDKAINIPPVAVVATPDGGHFLWIYQPESETVTRRGVQIGALTSDGLQILEGLAPGEIVVTRGVHQLTEGMRVTLLEE